MSNLSIAVFKAIIDGLAEKHPTARVDFVYPKRHGGKRRSALGNMTSYSVLMSNVGDGIVRISLDWARSGENPVDSETDV